MTGGKEDIKWHGYEFEGRDATGQFCFTEELCADNIKYTSITDNTTPYDGILGLARPKWGMHLTGSDADYSSDSFLDQTDAVFNDLGESTYAS